MSNATPPSVSNPGEPVPLNVDIAAISQIDAGQKILEVVCRSTGMGFSAVAKVTDLQWIACAVRDEISFGLVPGGELQLSSTICHEIRQSGNLVAIDDVVIDDGFCELEVKFDPLAPRRWTFGMSKSTPHLSGRQEWLTPPVTAMTRIVSCMPGESAWRGTITRMSAIQ